MKTTITRETKNAKRMLQAAEQGDGGDGGEHRAGAQNPRGGVGDGEQDDQAGGERAKSYTKRHHDPAGGDEEELICGGEPEGAGELELRLSFKKE